MVVVVVVVEEGGCMSYDVVTMGIEEKMGGWRRGWPTMSSQCLALQCMSCR